MATLEICMTPAPVLACVDWNLQSLKVSKETCIHWFGANFLASQHRGQSLVYLAFFRRLAPNLRFSHLQHPAQCLSRHWTDEV